MSDQKAHEDERSRGDQLIEEMRRHRPGQFRVASMFVAMLVISLALAFPRIVGWEYTSYLQFLWMVIFAMAPLIALTVTWWLPFLRFQTRLLIAAVTVLVIVLPLCLWMASLGEWLAILQVFVVTALFFWLPQTVSIAGVWFFLFRR